MKIMQPSGHTDLLLLPIACRETLKAFFMALRFLKIVSVFVANFDIFSVRTYLQIGPLKSRPLPRQCPPFQLKILDFEAPQQVGSQIDVHKQQYSPPPSGKLLCFTKQENILLRIHIYIPLETRRTNDMKIALFQTLPIRLSYLLRYSIPEPFVFARNYSLTIGQQLWHRWQVNRFCSDQFTV